MVLNVTDIIFGCPRFGSKSSKSIECNEKEGCKSSLAFFTQLNVCIVDARLASDDEPVAIITKKNLSNKDSSSH